MTEDWERIKMNVDGILVSDSINLLEDLMVSSTSEPEAVVSISMTVGDWQRVIDAAWKGLGQI